MALENITRVILYAPYPFCGNLVQAEESQGEIKLGSCKRNLPYRNTHFGLRMNKE